MFVLYYPAAVFEEHRCTPLKLSRGDYSELKREGLLK